MEPCAPGTEDDPPIMYSTLTKKENEQQRLLSQKAFFKNGKYGNVFELIFQNGTEHWYCNACECPVMGRAFQHEIGRRHTLNISNSNQNPDAANKTSNNEEAPTPLEIAPGEPLPPGFEHLSRVSQIQERLDGFKVGPLVALEYLIELQDDDPSKEPFYLCILCDKKGDPRTVLTHLASYNHISQYLQKHFPTCWRVLAPYNTKQYRRNWQTALQKIAEGIEKKFGRLKPYPIEKDKFEKDRMHYLQIVAKGVHFSELSGYTFEELVVPDELTKSLEVEEKSYETSTTHNWGAWAYIQKPFKKRSPSPPVVGIPSKKAKGNAQTNPRRQESAFTTATENKPQSQPIKKPNIVAPAETQPNRPSIRRRSLSSVSSASDKSEKNDKERRFERGRNTRGRGGFIQRNNRPPFNRDNIPFGRRRSPSLTRRRSPSPLKRRSPLRRRSPSPRRRSPLRRRSVSPNPHRRRSQSPTHKAEQEREKLRKVEEFRKLGRAIENDMFKTLKQHEKNPEKHPQYNEEWKKFWNRRYKELKTAGVDVAKHDFKPEWIEFWNKRMVEIHSDELRNRKEALRKRLGLPEEMNPIKFKIGAGSAVVIPGKVTTPKPTPMAAQPDQDDEVIIIDDKDDDRTDTRSPWEEPSRHKGGPNKFAKRSPSPKSKKSRERSPVRRLRDSPVRRTSSTRYGRRSKSRDRSRSRDKLFVRKRSLSKDKFRPKNAPLNEPSRNSRPVKRSASREKFFGRRSRSKDGSKSTEKGSVKQNKATDMILSRDRNVSPISVESNFSSKSKERSTVKSSRSRSINRSPRNKSPSRERSWERKRAPRESSFERDLRGRERIRTVADLPWEREGQKGYRKNPYLPPPIMREATRKPMNLPDDDEDEGEVNVVDVLRLLTALEDRLGSLGPKVIDLLAQALALEKNEANSSEQLLDNEINGVLFETVKEKLKGQMFAGLVDVIQERAFKKAIKKIASLMHLAAQRKRQRDKLLPKLVPGGSSGGVDKAAIARQIANALIAQGKTDVTQMELEQLINAVVGMAEASKVTSKPMTTAGFLEMLGGGPALDFQKTTRIDLEKLTEPLTPSPGKNSINNMENLSDVDLQTLLQNFKDLSTEEQHNLINYLKKLEYQEPERVEKLRKFVNLDPNSKQNEDSNNDAEDEGDDSKRKAKGSGRESPFSNREGGVNPDQEEVNIESDGENENKKEEETEEADKEDTKTEKDKTDKKVSVDSEEDEYTFEDVVKTVSKNVKDKEMEHNKKVLEETMKYDKSKSNLSSAKDLISELMSNINKTSSTGSNTVDLLGLGKPAPVNTMPNVDLTKLLNINVASLASIVNNVKNMSSNDARPPSPGRSQVKLNFDLGQLKPEVANLGVSGPANLNREPLEPNRPLDRGIGSGGPAYQGDFDRFGPPRQDRFVPGGPDRFDFELPDRFGPTGPDRFADRFGPGNAGRFGPGGADRFTGSDRFAPGGPDRFAPDRFGMPNQERFNQRGPDRMELGGPDRMMPGGPDRMMPGGPDRMMPGGPGRMGPGGPDRMGSGGPDRMGGLDRMGAGDRMPLGGQDRLGPGGADRFGYIPPDRGFGGQGLSDRNLSGPVGGRSNAGGSALPPLGGPRMSGPAGPRPMLGGGPGGPGIGNQHRPNPFGGDNFGSKPGGHFSNEKFNRGAVRPNMQRLPAPDFNRQGGGNFNRW